MHVENKQNYNISKLYCTYKRNIIKVEKENIFLHSGSFKKDGYEVEILLLDLFIDH